MTYEPEHVALTMGGTAAMSSLADFLLLGAPSSSPALCAIPNYPPLVESVARRHGVQLVPLAVVSGLTSLEPLLSALKPDTPFVMFQTVANPTGAAAVGHRAHRPAEHRHGGTELAVWRSFDAMVHRPSVVVVEYEEGRAGRRAGDLCGAIGERYALVRRTPSNLILARRGAPAA